MSTLREQVVEWLEQIEEDGCCSLMNEELPEAAYDENEDRKPLPFELACVEHYGGEGQGDTYYAVWKFENKEESLHVRFNGCYASHYGADYSDYDFVVAKEVTVVKWKATK